MNGPARSIRKQGLPFRERRFCHRSPHLFADEGYQSDLLGRVLVGVTVLDIDDTHHLGIAHERYREQSFIGVFNERHEVLKAGIFGCPEDSATTE